MSDQNANMFWWWPARWLQIPNFTCSFLICIWRFWLQITQVAYYKVKNKINIEHQSSSAISFTYEYSLFKKYIYFQVQISSIFVYKQKLKFLNYCYIYYSLISFHTLKLINYVYSNCINLERNITYSHNSLLIRLIYIEDDCIKKKLIGWWSDFN
jgi:hypothetical protein